MSTGRRSFVAGMVTVLAGAKALIAGQPQQDPFPPSAQYPGRRNRSGDDSPLPPRPDPKEQLKENQKKLRGDADRLLQLAQELKEEADNTEQTDVLSLPLIHKAEEIEKLAHQIKGLARAD